MFETKNDYKAFLKRVLRVNERHFLSNDAFFVTSTVNREFYLRTLIDSYNTNNGYIKWETPSVNIDIRPALCGGKTYKIYVRVSRKETI